LDARFLESGAKTFLILDFGFLILEFGTWNLVLGTWHLKFEFLTIQYLIFAAQIMKRENIFGIAP